MPPSGAPVDIDINFDQPRATFRNGRRLHQERGHRAAYLAASTPRKASPRPLSPVLPPLEWEDMGNLSTGAGALKKTNQEGGEPCLTLAINTNTRKESLS